jgi:hypothetical protein
MIGEVYSDWQIGTAPIRSLSDSMVDFSTPITICSDHVTELAWLIGHRFQSLTRREFDWLIIFGDNVSLVVACLWRLVEDGRIRVTSQDDGQQFGLPAPVDAEAEVNRRLEQASVRGVELREGTLDLEVQFSTGHSLHVIPDSSGYEAWNLSAGSRLFIATGGGELEIFEGEPG